MQITCECPTCGGDVRATKGESGIWSGKCSHCRGDRNYDIVTKDGKTTISPIIQGKPIEK